MKKNIVLTFCLLTIAAITVMAGPAFPGRILYTQPDGTQIGIHLYGDEYGHWVTDDTGNVLEQDEEGYWKPAGLKSSSILTIQENAAVRRAAANELRKASSSQSTNFGSPKIPVILVGFSDKAFSKTNADFTAMLMQEGYSANSAIGSVYDYFNENSFGQFTPQFEVLGPVTLDNNMSYYGANNSSGDDTRPEMALVHAAQKLDSTVDFSRYDNDGDGTVDFVMFYYAGYDEAQGGSTNCIWSHAWYLSASSNARNSRTFDGVKIDSYFCTAELKGRSGSTMCSIGTTCHEFAHTLGLPDFYDADYTTNGSAANMYTYDLMASGSYNVNSTTPPYLNSEELSEIGWLAAIPDLATTGSVTLAPVNYPGAKSYSAYKTKTSVSNEYFVYEARSNQRWDAGLPASGLLVYHVDKSTNRVSGSITAASTWNANSVNNYSAHPCCYVVPAGNPTSTSSYSGSNVLFGNTVNAFTPVAWSGNTTGFYFTEITKNSDGSVSFKVSNSNVLGISGVVLDSDSRPISGASIIVTAGSGISPAPSMQSSKNGGTLINKSRMKLNAARRLTPRTRAASGTVTTASDGSYTIELEAGTYQVTAAKEGYVSQTAIVTVSSVIETQIFYLMREGEEIPSTINAWPEGLTEYVVGSSSNSLTGQNLYPASELGKYAGKQLKEFTFYLHGDSDTKYQGVYVIIDYGDTRKATIPVSEVTVGGYTTVDLREYELVIPSGTDIYAGVGYSSGGYSYNGGYYSFGAFYKMDDDSGEYYDWAVNWPYDGLVSAYNLTSTGERYSWDLIFDFVLEVGDFEAQDTGYNYIADPGKGVYSTGDRFQLDLIRTSGDRAPQGAISWYYDDELVSGTSVSLKTGHHVVEARFTTVGGSSKVVELEIDVE